MFPKMLLCSTAQDPTTATCRQPLKCYRAWPGGHDFSPAAK